MVGHRNAPDADPACLYGLIGDVARAGSEGTETNAVAIAANFMAYLSCAVGRCVYLPIGNTRHHARLFCLHIGRSGRGRKGDAVSLVLRIDQALRAMDDTFAPQVHRGGLLARTWAGHAQPDQRRVLPWQGAEGADRRLSGASAGLYAAEDQRANGRTPHRCAGHADARVPACVARKLISLVSPGKNACKCLSALSFR